MPFGKGSESLADATMLEAPDAFGDIIADLSHTFEDPIVFLGKPIHDPDVIVCVYQCLQGPTH